MLRKQRVMSAMAIERQLLHFYFLNFTPHKLFVMDGRTDELTGGHMDGQTRAKYMLPQQRKGVIKMYVDKGVHVSLDVISAYYNDFTW